MRFVDLPPGDPRLASVWPVARQLRTELDEATLAERYAAGHPEGYRLTAAFDEEGACLAVAGWRITTTFAHGRFCYVDDLVTDGAHRSTGVGAALLTHVEDRARAAACRHVRLDSGVQRHDAHRFYFRQGYRIASYSFTKEL